MNPSFPPSPGWFFLIAGIAAVAFAIQQASRKRAYEHTERMKALEMGVSPAGDSAWPAAVCIAIGAVVPVTALAVAMVVTLVTQRTMEPENLHLAWSGNRFEEFHGIVWGCATAVGIFAVVGGVLLSLRLLGRRRLPSPTQTDAFAHDLRQKPAFDPEAYDTVSRRG